MYNCILKNPAVKLMMAAMNKSGWYDAIIKSMRNNQINKQNMLFFSPFDVRRHIACEVCHSSVHGGFDSEMNQIVICQNNTDASRVPSILTHEMIHMYDFCKHNIDFKDIDHLACTEIRAANLAHCTFLSAIMNGESSVLRIRKGQQVGIPFSENIEDIYILRVTFSSRNVLRLRQCNLWLP